MALTEIPSELSSTPSIVDNGNSTAITIDSSERVLIGKTATGLGASGTEINPNGYIQVTEDQSPPLYLNRLNTDGSIVNFYKDGTTVGSIGVDNNDNFQIGATTSGHGGLYFGNGSIAPMAGNSRVQDTLDLGNATYRFKDLHLSGGVNFSANANAGGMTSELLDDYETGTWTPIINGDGGATTGQSYGTVTAHYVKIGQLVYLGFDVALTTLGSIGGNYAVINNLPFPALNSNLGGGSLGYYRNISQATGPINFYVSASQAYLMKGGDTYVAKTDLTNATRLIGFLSYRTSV